MKWILLSLLFIGCTHKVYYLNQRQGELVKVERVHRDTTILTFKPILSKDTGSFVFILYGKGVFRIGDKYTIRYDSVRKGDCKVLATLKRNF